MCTAWALAHTLGSLYGSGNVPSLVIGGVALALQIWLTVEALGLLLRREPGAAAAAGG